MSVWICTECGEPANGDLCMNCGHQLPAHLPGGPQPGSPFFIEGIRNDRFWLVYGVSVFLLVAITGGGFFVIGLALLGLIVIALTRLREATGTVALWLRALTRR